MVEIDGDFSHEEIGKDNSIVSVHDVHSDPPSLPLNGNVSAVHAVLKLHLLHHVVPGSPQQGDPDVAWPAVLPVGTGSFHEVSRPDGDFLYIRQATQVDLDPLPFTTARLSFGPAVLQEAVHGKSRHMTNALVIPEAGGGRGTSRYSSFHSGKREHESKQQRNHGRNS